MFDTPKSVLENHIKEGFMIKEIASMLSVSESTIYRRMQTYGLSSLDFSDVSDEDLGYMSELLMEFPFYGEGIMIKVSSRKRH